MAKNITTPFGTVDLEPERIKPKLKDSPYNTELRIEWEGIDFLSVSQKYARLAWRLVHYDLVTGLPINDDILATKRFTSDITNSNKVTSDGITINEQTFPPVPVLDENNNIINYDRSAYEEALAIGHPEFDYWFGTLHIKSLPEIVETAIGMLITLNKFE